MNLEGKHIRHSGLPSNRTRTARDPRFHETSRSALSSPFGMAMLSAFVPIKRVLYRF